MEVIRDKSGNVKSSSRNLRGIVRAFGKQLIKVISIDPIADGEGKLYVLFDNGDSFETNFASFTTLRYWIKARRNLRGVKLIDCGVETVV